MSNANIQVLDFSMLEAEFIKSATFATASLSALKDHKTKAGEILHRIREATPHGQWEPKLAELCKRAQISRSTAHNYLNAFLKKSRPDAKRQRDLKLEKGCFPDRFCPRVYKDGDVYTVALTNLSEAEVIGLAFTELDLQDLINTHGTPDIVFNHLNTDQRKALLVSGKCEITLAEAKGTKC